MREPRPSLAYRLAWMFPPISIGLFAIVVEGRRLFDLSDTDNLIGGLAGLVYFAIFAVQGVRDAIRRRTL